MWLAVRISGCVNSATAADDAPWADHVECFAAANSVEVEPGVVQGGGDGCGADVVIANIIWLFRLELVAPNAYHAEEIVAEEFIGFL